MTRCTHKIAARIVEFMHRFSTLVTRSNVSPRNLWMVPSSTKCYLHLPLSSFML